MLEPSAKMQDFFKPFKAYEGNGTYWYFSGTIMIQSKLIRDILDLTLDGFESEELARGQIPFLSEGDKEYTGMGLYVYFTVAEGIENHRIPTDKATNFNVDGSPAEVLPGVEIKNDGLNVLADTLVHFKNGFIECVEIWNKNGEDYPKEEPESYELIQNWRDAKGRTIKR